MASVVQGGVAFLLTIGILLCLGGQGKAQTQQQEEDGQILPKNCQGADAVLDVASERMTFDRYTRTFTFEEKVRVQQCGMTILCDRLHVTNSAEGESVERIIATGNVRIQQHERQIVAEHVEYHAAEQKLVLTGNPRVWDTQEQNELTGEEIIIFLQRENLVARQARVRFYPHKRSLKGP